MNTSLSIQFSPLVPEMLLYLFIAAAAFLLVLSFWKARHLGVWRIVAAAAFLLVLANPSLLEEKREAVKDVAAIIIDQSPSQKMGEREIRAEEAANKVAENLTRLENLDVRIIRAPKTPSIQDSETRLFDALQSSLSDVPPSRRAGAIFITDGQVHDLPQDKVALSQFGPLHTLLTGEKDEKDRQVKIINAPAYGLVGDIIEITYRIEDTKNIGQSVASAAFTWDGTNRSTRNVVPDESQTIKFKIENAGQNIFQIEADSVPGELTQVNNRATVVVNGVRDRLKVLLVSGQPHNGERTWRDMLTEDPGVDLVHFTILREPHKLDLTPSRELSLIPFPFRELFEVKLYDFDLIIFDRYSLNRVMPDYYYSNIARYVREGGALLESSGPSFADEMSLYNTELKDVFPGAPTGEVYEAAYKPEITALGLNHPVTMDFGDTQNYWGQWLRQVGILESGGDTVLKGLDGKPLMILSRVGKGRVAQIASDQIWLWSRGYDGGGPHRELLRRTAHWLMKEPELDENALDAVVRNSEILIRRRSLEENEKIVTVTKPDGEKEEVVLSRENSVGWLSGTLQSDQIGVYAVSDGTQSYSFVAGDINTPELTGIISTEEIMSEAAEASQGTVNWLGNGDAPDIKHIAQGRKYSGLGWVGLRANDDYAVTGLKSRSLLPPLAALFLLTLLSVWMWWREGKSV